MIAALSWLPLLHYVEVFLFHKANVNRKNVILFLSNVIETISKKNLIENIIATDGYQPEKHVTEKEERYCYQPLLFPTAAMKRPRSNA